MKRRGGPDRWRDVSWRGEKLYGRSKPELFLPGRTKDMKQRRTKGETPRRERERLYSR